jgi:plastocyanin
MRPERVRALALAAALAASGVAGAATHVVTIERMAFGTMPSGARVGDVVEWHNADVVPHTATAARAGFDVELAPGATATTVLDAPGRFDVTCTYHPTMRAELVVE